MANPVLFYLMLIGLTLFCIGLIANTYLSGHIDWAILESQRFNVEDFVSAIILVIGLCLLAISSVASILLNRYSSDETAPQESAEA
ncbi:MAG: hypothetical protein ABSB10_08850 [Candidatus Bathyarchaeia archaeon]